jgi:hypothetical protein
MFEEMLAVAKSEVGIMQSLVHPHIERVISTYDVVTRNVLREFSFTMRPMGEEDLSWYIERISTCRLEG